MAENGHSLEQVREHIDSLDRQIVRLIAERGIYVSHAAHFKKDRDAVKNPQRVEQVIAKVTNLEVEMSAYPIVIEAVYRAMIAAFIEQELAEHSALHSSF
ncbi:MULTISPECIES: chorismate mutase [unclassified Pseudomonas]|uniref:chorismate mutase n=1 Tax=unclassified Pseudomonas TaxID=196821 RepID=UPI003859E6E5